MSALSKTKYQIRTAAFTVPGVSISKIELISILPYKERSTIFITRNGNKYISNNRGETWQIVEWPCFSNLKNWGLAELENIMSRIDNHVLYDCTYKSEHGFKISTDGGRSWSHIDPAVSTGETIHAIELIETGIHNVQRLYARIWTDDGSHIGVSNDYGRHFKLLPWEITGIMESRSDSSVLYGRVFVQYYQIMKDQAHPLRKSIKSVPYEQICDTDYLAISKDEGKNWELMQGSREVFKKLYISRLNNTDIRSWKQYPDDKIFINTGTIMQIESDPKNAEMIYVLTYKGLYFSRDAGKTFRLSTLAHGWVMSMRRIAVDPLDGRYIYAEVDAEKIYPGFRY